MINSDTRKGLRPARFCEMCAGDKPWGSKNWFLQEGLTFCCPWCFLNYVGRIKQLWFRGKITPTNAQIDMIANHL